MEAETDDQYADIIKIFVEIILVPLPSSGAGRLRFPLRGHFSPPYQGQSTRRSPPIQESRWAGSEDCHSSDPHGQNPAEAATEPSDQKTAQGSTERMYLRPGKAFPN